MQRAELIRRLETTETLFGRTTGVLEEKHSSFRPTLKQFTVAQHVAHTAQTIDWFREGALGEGYDMDFPRLEAEVRAATSLDAARSALAAAFERAREAVTGADQSVLDEAPTDGEIMPGLPRWGHLLAVEEHTAHHRGSLAVYARLLSLEPPMPYAG